MDRPHIREYSFDTLPPVLYDNIAYVTGTGEATIVSAHTVYLDQGTLRVHGTGTETIVVKASGDSSVSAYGNVLVLASDQARVYSYNNSYVVASGQANVLMFDAGVLVANDAARGILHNSAQGYAHGQSMIQGFENAALTATDESILSVRDNSHAELRGNSTAYVYDLSVTHGYDTAQVHVESPLVSVQLRHNAVAQVANAELASTLHSPDNRPDNFLVFYQPATNEPNGMIHLADGSRLIVDDSEENASQDTNMQENAADEVETGDVSVDEEIESLGRHGHEGGMSVADLLARNASENKDSGEDNGLDLLSDDDDDEEEVEPEQIRAGSDELEDVDDSSDLKVDSSDPSSLLDGFGDSFSTISADDTGVGNETSSVDVASEDSPEPINPETDTVPNTQTAAPVVERTGFRPHKPDDSVPAGAASTTMKRPAGDTVQEQLEGQGWAIITPPTGMMLGLEYTSDEEVASYRSSSAASSSSSPSSSSTISSDNDVEEFDFGDDDDDDFDLTIPGYDKD